MKKMYGLMVVCMMIGQASYGQYTSAVDHYSTRVFNNSDTPLEILINQDGVYFGGGSTEPTHNEDFRGLNAKHYKIEARDPLGSSQSTATLTVNEAPKGRWEIVNEKNPNGSNKLDAKGKKIFKIKGKKK
jgi:hypothetical protein